MVLLAGQVKQEYWWRCLLIQVGKEWTGFVVEGFVKYLQNAKSAAWMNIAAKSAARKIKHNLIFNQNSEHAKVKPIPCLYLQVLQHRTSHTLA